MKMKVKPTKEQITDLKRLASAMESAKEASALKKRLASFRDAGISPEAVIGWLAFTCGWNAKKTPIRLQSLIGCSPLETVPHEAVVWTGSFT